MKAKHLLISVFLTACAATIAQVPEHWLLDEVNPGQDISLYPDGSNVQEGTYSCRMTLEQPEVPYLLSKKFEVNVGDPYDFSIHYYDNDNRGTLKIYADFLDADSTVIWGEDPVESIDMEEWQELSWSGTVPAGSMYGFVLVKFYDDDPYVDEAIAWVDNAKFTVGGENLVLNPSFESWPTVNIKKNESLPEVSIYPNPVVEKATLSNLQEVDRLELRNVFGQCIFGRTLEGIADCTVDLSGFPNGVYFVNGYSNNRPIKPIKIIKN